MLPVGQFRRDGLAHNRVDWTGAFCKVSCEPHFIESKAEDGGYPTSKRIFYLNNTNGGPGRRQRGLVLYIDADNIYIGAPLFRYLLQRLMSLSNSSPPSTLPVPSKEKVIMLAAYQFRNDLPTNKQNYLSILLSLVLDVLAPSVPF